ncbi:MAG: cytoplasmic protein [Desulfobacterales bacterium]
MIKDDLILRNPLRLLGHDTDDVLADGNFGAVCARAGVGKTALVVQLALNGMLRDKNILHISLNDPVDKVTLWYQEVFHNLVQGYPAHESDRLLETLLPHRFIMNFKVEGFSVPKLEERLMDLTSQNIFTPEIIILDGLFFDDSVRESLTALKSIAEKQAMHVWFTMRTHREETTDATGLVPPLSLVEDLFEAALQLQPEGKDIHVNYVKGKPSDATPPDLLLDPSTMLVKGTT